jgi:hypothetical protein
VVDFAGWHDVAEVTRDRQALRSAARLLTRGALHPSFAFEHPALSNQRAQGMPTANSPICPSGKFRRPFRWIGVDILNDAVPFLLIFHRIQLA